MKKLLPILLLAFVFTQCDEDDNAQCSIVATVRDLTGFDGCGIVLELEDGSRIEPVLPILFCGTPPLPKEITEDPIYGFEFVDGKRVKISYKETGDFSICMIGPVVKITCIEEVIGPTSD
jgi:hypothetical protein